MTSVNNYRRLIFGIDFDGTITEDPKTFRELVHLLKIAGHQVYVVTYRHETLDKDSLLDKFATITFKEVIYTDGKAKDKFCRDLGIPIDIWIEDNPRAVHNDSAWTHDSPELHAWREENKAKLEDSTLKVS